MPPTTSSSSDASPSAALREDLVRTMRGLEADGLNRAAAGNASARCGAHFLITPTGVLPADLQPGAMVEMTLDGTPLAARPVRSGGPAFPAGRIRPAAGFSVCGANSSSGVTGRAAIP